MKEISCNILRLIPGASGKGRRLLCASAALVMLLKLSQLTI